MTRSPVERPVSPAPGRPHGQTRLRDLGVLVGLRRGLRRVTGPPMSRILVAVVRGAILGGIVLGLMAAAVGTLLPLSAMLLSIALNLLGTTAAMVGLIVLIGAIWSARK